MRKPSEWPAPTLQPRPWLPPTPSPFQQSSLSGSAQPRGHNSRIGMSAHVYSDARMGKQAGRISIFNETRPQRKSPHNGRSLALESGEKKEGKVTGLGAGQSHLQDSEETKSS